MTPNDCIFYFLGVDPAPAESSRSDDGAVIIIRAEPKSVPDLLGDIDGELSNNPAHWWRDVVYARRFKKLRSRDWAGHIHHLHRRFGFVRICLDPGGGGIFIKRDLASNRQLLSGVEQDVTPIVPIDEKGLAIAHFILSMFKRGDVAVESLWPGLQGDDCLVDACYAAAKDALDTGEFALTPPFYEWPKESREGWPEEKVWALKNLHALQEQMKNVIVATKDDGSFAFTRRNARQFSARGKKDLVSAWMYANVAFLSWLQDQDGLFSVGTSDGGMCSRL